MSLGSSATLEVDEELRNSFALGFVDCDCPRKDDRELAHTADSLRTEARFRHRRAHDVPGVLFKLNGLTIMVESDRDFLICCCND